MSKLTPELEEKLRECVNPIYADQPGTESYERSALLGEIDRLRAESVNAELLKAAQRSLNWLSSYPGGGTMGHAGPYEQMLAAIARAESAQAQQADVRGVPTAVGVSIDSESPGKTGVLVTFRHQLTDDELRSLHDLLATPPASACRSGC